MKTLVLKINQFKSAHVLKITREVAFTGHDTANGCVCKVPTSYGNHGKPGKILKKVPCMEKSWNLKNNN